MIQLNYSRMKEVVKMVDGYVRFVKSHPFITLPLSLLLWLPVGLAMFCFGLYTAARSDDGFVSGVGLGVGIMFAGWGVIWPILLHGSAIRQKLGH